MSDPQYTNITDPRFTRWRKSTRSGGSESCVEVSEAVDGSGDVAVADSKAGPSAPIRVFTRPAWGAFVAAAKADTLV